MQGIVYFRIPHKPKPNLAASQIFRAQERYSQINSDNIRIRPIGFRIKSIDESVISINFIAEFFPHFAQRGNGNVGREHQRASRGARHDRSVQRRGTWWRAPGDVTVLAVRSR